MNKFFLRFARLSQPPFHLKNWRFFRLAIFVIADVLTIAAACWCAFLLRLEDNFFAHYYHVYWNTLPVVVLCHIAVFWVGGMYRQVWRFANATSALVILKCVLIGTVAAAVIIYYWFSSKLPPRSIPAIQFMLIALFVGIQKFSWRAWAEYLRRIDLGPKTRCIIYGAGSAGELLSRHIVQNLNSPYKPVCFVDDDRNKKNRSIHSLRIEGQGKDLKVLCAKYGVKTIIIAMPSVPGKTVRDIVNTCKAIGVKPLIMPDLSSTLDQRVVQPRNLDINDLLRRAPKQDDKEPINQFFANKTVLVTGAGGSIGSELCRQICESKPGRIVLVDSSEFNLFKIDLELEHKFPDIERYSVLLNVANDVETDRVIAQYKPFCIMHAAAYKHVPMVEKNPTTGILNNVLGTKNVAEAAIKHGVLHFVLISTDKAVNPTNVMGSSKRCCELLIQCLYAQNPGLCKFTAVRFGNVLGSSGSVVPQFLEQIQAGGPITVTHPDVTRYFMLTGEAVGLVLRSAVHAKGGEIYVLNMGEPVRIFDMATQLIELAGKVPGKDIEIVFTGLRPGEKLYEELILEGTEQTTLHEDIFILKPQEFDHKACMGIISDIISSAQLGEEARSIKLLRSLVGYRAPTAPRIKGAQLELVTNVD